MNDSKEIEDPAERCPACKTSPPGAERPDVLEDVCYRCNARGTGRRPDFRPDTSTGGRWSRPPLSEVPSWALQAEWKWAVPGGWELRVAKIGRAECRACALWYRVYEDEPRPCPSCTEREARQAEREDAARYFEGGKLREKALLAELAAARKVINVVADRQAVPGSDIPRGAGYVRQLVSALDEWHRVRVDEPAPPPLHVAVFDDGQFEFVRRFSVLAEAEAFKDWIEACPSLHSTGGSVYLLPEQEASMQLDQHADEVAKVEKTIAAEVPR